MSDVDEIIEMSDVDEIIEMSDVVDDIPAVVNQAPFSLEEARVCPGPDDKMLLDLIGRTSPYLAVQFLKVERCFSQAALDVAFILACQRGFICLAKKLVKLGADTECRDASGKTPLLICVENHYFDLVRFLVDRGADVIAVDCAGNNALILSVSSEGSMEMLHFLLEKADIMINHQNNDGYTAVMKALEVMDVDLLKLLLETYFCDQQSNNTSEGDSNWTLLDQTVNCKGETAQQIAEKHGLGAVLKRFKECISEGTSPIEAAVRAYDLETLDFLLVSELVPEIEINEAFLSLFLKYYDNEQNPLPGEILPITKRLLECGADVNSFPTNSIKPSPVSVAVDAGDYDLVELLCKHGAPLNQQMDESDKVPLCLAAKNGRMDLIELLLKYNADVNTHSFDNSPLDCALIHGHIDCARCLVNHGAKMDTSAISSVIEKNDLEYMKILFQQFENETINCLLEDNKDGNNLLIEAVEVDNLEIIEQILQAGVDVNIPQQSGTTPIVESKNEAVALLLIRYGADVNHVTDDTNETPLIHVLKRLSHYMTYSDKEDVVRMLLENGASVRARTRCGTTPLMLAANRGQRVILQTLLHHGADCSDQDNDGNTALLHAILGLSSATEYQYCNHGRELIGCINALLDKGVNASFLCPPVFPTVITNSCHDLIPKLIHCSLGASEMNIDDIPLQVYQRVNCLTLSPLCLALLVNNVSVARYFWRIMFMTNSDLYLSSNKILRCFLQRKDTKKSKECLSFLDEVLSQPMSLFKMCFVAVTSAVGASPGREAKISKLPLPLIVKDKLLFKSDVDSFATPENGDHKSDIPIDYYDFFHYVSDADSEEDNSDYEHDSLHD